MLTPQNFREKTFERAVFGGYDMGAVDNFLDEAANDYAAIAKENITLKQKMKVLVDTIEEYRATEESMRQTLLAAQKLSSQIEQDAKSKAEKLFEKAKVDAERVTREAYTQRTTEEAKLVEAKRASTQYIENMRMITQKQLEFFEGLDGMKLEDIGNKNDPMDETVQSIKDSVEKKSDEADAINPAIGKVVSDNSDTTSNSDAEPTRMYKSGEPTLGVDVANIKFGK